MKWEWLACPRATTMQASCLLQYVRNGIIRSAGLRLRPSPSILYSSETMKELIRPHGGELRELFADAARASVLKQEALALPSCDLTLRQQAELALLMNGAYSPLSGFMCRADYDAVLEPGHLASGELWPLPVTLDIVEALLGKTLAFYVGGRVEGVEAPSYHSFTGLRHSPAELRREFAKRGWTRVAAFHTTAPIHAAQQRLSTRAARELGANLLVQPVVEEGTDYYYRVRCYRAAWPYFAEQSSLLSLLTLPRRHAGGRELLLHAIVRQNHGCSALLWEEGGDGFSIVEAGRAV